MNTYIITATKGDEKFEYHVPAYTEREARKKWRPRHKDEKVVSIEMHWGVVSGNVLVVGRAK